MYLHKNILHEKTMSQKLPVDGFKFVENISDFTEDFIKNYNDTSDIGYFLTPDIIYPELGMSHNNLSFLPKKKKIGACEKLVCNLNNTNYYVVHIKNLK